MGKRYAALAGGPQTELVITAGTSHSVESLRALANKIETMQLEAIADGTYTAEVCNSNTPYTEAIWDITVAAGNVAGDYQAAFNDETIVVNDAIGKAALSTRRKITVGIAATTNEYSMRSFRALINFIEKLEDQVAETGSGAAGDGTYTDVALKGSTPYETFNWTVTKLAAAYTVTVTATS